MANPRNHNRIRDLNRSRNPRNRTPRVWVPVLGGGSEYERSLILDLARTEMDHIRQVETHKWCSRCEQVKETSSGFHKDNLRPDGWYRICKECRKQK